MSEKDTIISVRDIWKSYSSGPIAQQVLRGVDLCVRRGEFIAIMGASGSGKSTLLHILGLLDRPDKGQVYFEERDIFTLRASQQDRLRNLDFGFVFQFYHLLPELTVLENVMLPLMVKSSIWGWLTQSSRQKKRAWEVLAAVGLTDKAGQLPTRLSGGECQRVAIARALVQHPKLLLADEPTGNLDSAAGKVILEHLVGQSRRGQTIVMVTHDPTVAQLADRKLILRDGKIAAA